MCALSCIGDIDLHYISSVFFFVVVVSSFTFMLLSIKSTNILILIFVSPRGKTTVLVVFPECGIRSLVSSTMEERRHKQRMKTNYKITKRGCYSSQMP